MIAAGQDKAMLTGKELGAAIGEAIKKKGVAKVAVARHFNVSSPSIQDWVNRGTISKEKLPVLWAFFADVVGPEHWGLKSDELARMGREEDRQAESSNVEPAPKMRAFKGVPIVGEVKGGDDGYLDELQYPVGHGEGTVDYPTADPNAYALRVRGDSMHPRYRAGEFIVVEPSIAAVPGDDVVVSMKDGRKLLKELNWERDGEIQLLSVNNHFGPLTLQKSDVQYVQLVAGRVRRSAISKP